MQPSNSSHLLAELKDIHYPDPIGWWPLAPGWWILIITLFIVCIAAIYWFKKHFQQRRYRQQALKALQDIKMQSLLPKQTLDAAAQLIKRTLRAAPEQKGQRLLQLPDDDYKAYLSKNMTEQQAEWIAIKRYQPISDNDIDIDSLIKSVEDWIKKHKL